MEINLGYYRSEGEFDQVGVEKETVIGKSISEIKDEKKYSYEEALDCTGNGCYNYGLLVACSVVMMAMGIDMFGFSIVVTTSSCDLQLSLLQKGILSSMPFAGIILMSYPWGYISDTKGRKLTLVWAMIVSFTMSALSSFAPNWIVMAVLRFIGSSFSSAAQSATFTLLGECCNERVRSRYMLLMTAMLIFTQTVFFFWGFVFSKIEFEYDLPFLGIVYRPWRLLTLTMAMPLGIGAFLLGFYQESPKFLANLGKTEEALEVMRIIYAKNGGEPGKYPVKLLVLDEPQLVQEENISFLKSMWNQTAPLFQRPLLMRTLQLYFLNFVLYSTNNSFAMWNPFVFNAFFNSYSQQPVDAEDIKLCQLLSFNVSNSVDNYGGNSTEMQPLCNDRLDNNTAWVGMGNGFLFTLLNLVVVQFANRKKFMLLVVILVSVIGGFAVNIAPEPLSGISFFLTFQITSLGFGIISSYFVELYPTSYRGMVSCLGVMVARLSSLAGTNLAGILIFQYCTLTFSIWPCLVLCAGIVALYLPPDKPYVEKTSI